jgi:subtilisin family serine protease
MIGEALILNGITYEGIVSEAQIVFSTSETESEVLEAIDTMLSLGARVINYSAGIIYAEEYLDFDREIDRLARSSGLLFVTVSGNRRSVSSPGMSWGALTVGNLQTKSSPTAPSSPPYFIWCRNDVNCSGYLSAPDLAHKPDVVAPGTFVPYITPSYSVVSRINVGTSFACPWVSGIAVQVLQTLGNVSHLVLKAIIALSADRDIITEEFNPLISGEPFCRETTGFGLVNSENALRCAKEAEIIEGADGFEKDYFTSQENTLLVCLAYDKSIDTNENLSLYVSSLTANRSGQNLHLLEYTPTISENVPVRVEGSKKTEFALVVWKKQPPK